jgi:acyl-coenzyme A synthetase/AMP-(fatty) acid ligase
MSAPENPSDAWEHPERYILHSSHTLEKISFAGEGVRTLPELFKWQAERRRDATLFSFQTSDANLTTVSYTEAYERSSKLAYSLHNFYPTSRQEAPVVGVWFEKSIELHLAILATSR